MQKVEATKSVRMKALVIFQARMAVKEVKESQSLSKWGCVTEADLWHRRPAILAVKLVQELPRQAPFWSRRQRSLQILKKERNFALSALAFVVLKNQQTQRGSLHNLARSSLAKLISLSVQLITWQVARRSEYREPKLMLTSSIPKQV